MIRDYFPSDISSINELGKLIKDNFKETFNIEKLNKDYSNIYVYIENDTVMGFLHYEEHYEITDIINIAVKKEKQNKGIGETLINYLINNTTADKIMLEVSESNYSALKLYYKCGFKEINRRKKYYGNSDAIIMERLISK